MAKNTFYVKALWDGEAGVFYSESDITGLHIEAETLDEFKSLMDELARDLIVENHISKADFSQGRIADLMPTIYWQAPDGVAA